MFTHRFLRLFLWLCLLIPHALLAQLDITFPKSRLVFQRNNQNQATITVAGKCPANATQIQAQLIVRQGGTSTDWVVIDAAPSDGVFQGALSGITGGWYDLNVKAFAGSTELASIQIERIGVGEVFVTAGQSNSWGLNCSSGQATDDRISMINATFSGSERFYESALPFTVSHADLAAGSSGTGMFPGACLFLWGSLGDRLVNKLGVPVMFYGASESGTNSAHWMITASGLEDWGGRTKNFPYRGLGATILHYLKRTGVRAVLWHQGEGDNYYRSTQGYIDNLHTVIEKSRSQLGFGNLSWVVAQVSYIPAAVGAEYTNHETDPNIIAAQQALAAEPNNWLGPATDDMIYPAYRRTDYAHLHFDADDCYALTNVWDQALPVSYFTSTQPSTPTRSILLTTGYVFPFSTSPGTNLQVPYFSQVPTRSDNQYKVDLLSYGGCFLATLTSGTANPLTIALPGWTNGQYRFRVSATSPATTGEVSEPISVGGTGSGLPFPLPPNDLSTLQDGNWNNPLIWSCGWVPTLSNLTELKHTVTIPAGFQAETKTIRYVNGAKLIYENSGKVRLSGN